MAAVTRPPTSETHIMNKATKFLLALMLAMAWSWSGGCPPSSDGAGDTGGGPGSNGNGDEVDWDLPDLPSLAEEQAAIAPTIAGMKSALAARDSAAAAQWLAPEVRDAYEQSLAQTPESMPLLAAALESARLKMVSEDDRTGDGSSSRIGNVEIEYDGIVFHITAVKVDGTWLFLRF
jgi:hypothetical protein